MKVIFTLILSLMFAISFSQVDSIKINHRFEFRNGIYLSFEEFKTNSPSIKSSVINITLHPKQKEKLQTGNSGVDDAIGLINFLEYTIDNNNVEYFDKNNQEQKINISSIWGIYHDGQMYYRCDSRLYPISVFPLVTLPKYTLCLNTGNIFKDYKEAIEYYDKDLFIEYQNRMQNLKRKRDKKMIGGFYRGEFSKRNPIYIYLQ